ncbi:MAG: GntR family transcriptional regulator [Clostridiales Family XIII bacterium]|jgi:GntR family transcriptional regulator|nr:GntR family transcriptional regulator [Clostridiales Family XIII bacterium]
MFEVDLRSRKSIYEQVVDNLKELILIGVIAAEEKLPSVRELASTLTINPNTVQKAYAELERQGYVYTASGRGTFASNQSDRKPDAKRIEEAKKHFTDVIKELYYLGYDNAEIKELTNAILESESVQMMEKSKGGLK